MALDPSLYILCARHRREIDTRYSSIFFQCYGSCYALREPIRWSCGVPQSLVTIMDFGPGPREVVIGLLELWIVNPLCAWIESCREKDGLCVQPDNRGAVIPSSAILNTLSRVD